jgi:hypothetical protein
MFRNSKMLWAALLGASLALAAAPARDVDAKQATQAAKQGNKKKARKAAQKQPPKVETRAVSELMGGFEWGMAPKQVLDVLNERIDEKYEDSIRATTDVYEQDRLRKDANKEKNELKKSYVEFKGQRTGWDVSIVDQEYGHNDDESMIVYWEKDADKGISQRRFFFFVDQQLYKMYIAFDAQMFPDGKRTFPDFRAVMEARYGAGELVYDKDKLGEEVVKHVHWQGPKHYLRAVNKLEFYGTFALALSDPKVDTWIADRRAQRNPRAAQNNAIIDAVTEGDNAETTLTEGNADIVDHILRE